MTASVTIAVSEHDGVVVVPNEAVKTSASGSTVWIFNPGMKTPEMATVQAGATDGTYTEIDSGVNDKDTVVLAGWPPPGGFGGKMQMTPFGPRPARGPGH
jgi:multidrug efflux pump subunit AcrA (membrane-fusion protein)